MDKSYLIIITGHSCSGKSTLVKELQKSLPGTYHIGYDSIKGGLSGYDRTYDVKIVRGLLYGFMRVILEQGLPCINDAFFPTEEQYNKVIHLAQDHGYTPITVELRCPESIRLERFRERVLQAKTQGNRKISVTDEDIFRENMKKSFFFPQTALVYDTSLIETDEIAKIIISHLS